MNTQELKQYIDRVLGNNIRCLLPSYWWKRAFGAVIDKVDEKIDGSNLKTINGESIIGTGNLKVGTELRVITLPWQPNVRADENKRYDFTQEFIDAYATAYPDKAETVRSYGEKAFANNKEVFQILIEKAKLNESVDVVIDPVDAYKVFGYEIENYSIDFSASIPTSVSFMNVTSPKELKGCTLMPMPWGGDGGESEFCFMNHEYLYLMEDGSVEYKKYSAGSSGGITVDSELSETSENPVQNKVVTEVLTRFAYNANGMNIYLALGQTSLSAEQRTTNASTFSSLISGIVKPINCVTVTDTVKFQVQLYSWNGSSDRINLYISDWDNGNAFEKLKYRFFPDGSTEYVGRVTVDSELSETSENPIQNKAVYAALEEIRTSGVAPDEIYIGEEEPTDENVKVWINPNEQGESAGGGSGVARVYLPLEDELTEEQKEENRASFEKIKNGASIQFALNMAFETVNIDSESMYFYVPDDEEEYVGIVMTMHYTHADLIDHILSVTHRNYMFTLLPDGEVIQDAYAEEPSIPASSGPFRVWYSDAVELTEKQINDNKASYNEIRNGGTINNVYYVGAEGIIGHPYLFMTGFTDGIAGVAAVDFAIGLNDGAVTAEMIDLGLSEDGTVTLM